MIEERNQAYPERFVRQAIRFACQSLQIDGAFSPYVEILTIEGDGEHLGMHFQSRVEYQIESESRVVYESLVSKAANHEIAASAVVTSRSRHEGDEVIHSICVDTETREGFSAFVLFDYRHTEGDVDLAAPVLIAHGPRVFA